MQADVRSPWVAAHGERQFPVGSRGRYGAKPVGRGRAGAGAHPAVGVRRTARGATASGRRPAWVPELPTTFLRSPWTTTRGEPTNACIPWETAPRNPPGLG